MRSPALGILAAALFAATTIAPAWAEDRPISGFELSLTRAKSGKSRERLVFQSQDPSLLGPAAGGVDDPSLAGATIELFSDRDGLSAPIDVPPAAAAMPAVWASPGPNDYEFAHRAAPLAPTAVRQLQLRSGRKLRLTAKSVPFSLVGSTGATVIRISLGTIRYCARFDSSTVRTDKPGRYRAKDATSAGFSDCSDGALGIRTPRLPVATQACPTLVNGWQTIRGKLVKLWISPSATTRSGPFVFTWHGLGSSPDVAVGHLLGGGQLQRILDLGGVVAAFDGDGSVIEFTDYFPAADELLACAREQFAIDTRRIHSIGFSAGGLQTTRMSQERSNYIASIVAYSGGFRAAVQNPDNNFAALVVHGGPSDIYILHFDQFSVAYYNEIVAAGHFAILCNHNGGHTVPAAFLTGLGLQFLLDHPYGTDLSPYTGTLPAGYPAYCAGSE